MASYIMPLATYSFKYLPFRRTRIVTISRWDEMVAYVGRFGCGSNRNKIMTLYNLKDYSENRPNASLTKMIIGYLGKIIKKPSL